jgi:hypothetical protein
MPFAIWWRYTMISSRQGYASILILSFRGHERGISQITRLETSSSRRSRWCNGYTACSSHDHLETPRAATNAAHVWLEVLRLAIRGRGGAGRAVARHAHRAAFGRIGRAVGHAADEGYLDRSGGALLRLVVGTVGYIA